MRIIVIALAALLALTVFSMGAAAQTGPSTRLQITNFPSTPMVSDKGAALASMYVVLTVQNVVCTSSTTFPVQVVAKATQQATGGANSSSANATALVTPAQLNFNLAAGAYGNNPGTPAAQPFQQSQGIAVSLESPGLPNLTTYKVHVDAALANIGTGCQGTATVPPAAASAEYDVQFNNTQAPITTSPELPIPWETAPLALLAAVLVFRRRPA